MRGGEPASIAESSRSGAKMEFQLLASAHLGGILAIDFCAIHHLLLLSYHYQRPI
jgi:hypothetical protein